jgi:hypothetical protein
MMFGEPCDRDNDERVGATATRPEIAQELYLSVNTQHAHPQHLFEAGCA